MIRHVFFCLAVAVVSCASWSGAAPRLTLGPASVVEPDSGSVELVFEATLSEASATEVRASYFSQAFSAAAQEDFIPASGNLVFPPGILRQTVSISVIGDLLEEADEKFQILIADEVGTEAEGMQWPGQNYFGRPDPDQREQLGSAIALSGGTMVVGTDRLTATDGRAWIVRRSPADGAFGEFQELLPSQPVSKRFGNTVGVSGTTAVVGDRGNDCVFLFERDLGGAGSWGEALVLRQLGMLFGQSVAVDDGALVVGAPDASRVFVYRKSAEETWSVTPEFVATKTPPVGALGSVVAINGDRFAATSDSTLAQGLTEVTLYERSPAGEWSVLRVLQPLGFAPESGFGSSLAIGNDLVCVGAPDDTDGDGVVNGAVYIFGKDSGGEDAWGVMAKVTAPPGGGSNVNFGKSLSLVTGGLVAEVLVVGADQYGAGGASFVYRRVGSEWVLEQTLLPDGAAADSEFGEAVASGGGIIVVGAPEFGDSEQTEIGRVHVFEDKFAIGTIIDDDGGKLSAAALDVREGDQGITQRVFAVSLAKAAAADVRVDYETQGGSAEPGVDFAEVAGSLTIPAGALSALVPLQIFGDTLGEADESFFVSLSNPTIGMVETPMVEVFIRDDESPVVLEPLPEPSLVEGDLGSSLIEFPITLDSAAGADLIVGYETFPIEAEAGADYTDSAGELEIAAGEEEGGFNIEVLGDTIEEPDERFGVRVLPGGQRLVSDAWKPAFSGANYWTDAAEVAIDERHLAISNRGNVEVYKKSVAGWEQVAIVGGGRSVRLEGDTLIVGYSTIPNNESRVRVYERNWGGEDQWGEVTTLQPHWDLWGHFLDIDAGRVAIGVSDRAYIYARADGGGERWSLQAEIRLPSQVSSVALSGDWLLVGCGGLFSSEGGVIAYHRELVGGSEEWQPIHVLASPSPQPEFFGHTMSAEGADLVVGTLSGERATVFRLDETASRWKFVQELLPPGGEGEDRFGEKVVIDRDFIAVSGLEQVHVYRRGRDELASWILCQSIPRPEGLDDGVFGDPYGLGGGYLVAGSRRNSTVSARSFLFANLESSATIADDESPRISISGGNFLEPRIASGLVEVVVSLSVAASVDIVVDLSLVSESAEADRDFSLIDRQVIVPAGETSAVVAIGLVGDAETEADETFSVQIDGVSRGEVEGSSATITITDTLPEVMVAHVVTAEGDGEPAFSLRLSKPSDRVVSVSYAAVPRSALSPDDFNLPEGTRSFAPGEVEKSIPFSVTDDLVDEASEVFDLVLSQLDGAELPTIRPLGDPFTPSPAAAFDGAFLLMGNVLDEVQIYHVQPESGVTEVDQIRSPRPAGNPRFGTVVEAGADTVAIASGGFGDYVDIFEPAADGSGDWQQSFWRNTSAPVVALAVSPDTVVAGTPEVGANDLRIYRRGGDGQWRDGGTVAGDDDFGEVLALDGSQLAVSAPLGGYVRIYEIDFIGLATLSQEILPPAGVPAGAAFGSHLAIEGRVLLVGSPGNLGGSGMIHAYERDEAGTWSFAGSISPPSPDRQFGESFSLSGDLLVAAGYSEDSEVARIRFYRRTGGVWLAAGEEVIESGDSRLSDVFLGRSTVLALWDGGAQAFALPDAGATIEDNESPSIMIVDGEAVEGDRSITFEVRSSTMLHDGIDVEYATSDASAFAEIDYVAGNGSVRIPPGTNAALIRIDLIENSTTDGERVFRVAATSSSSGSITGSGAEGRIIDDDPRLLSIGSASLREGDLGLSRMRFPLVLSGAAPTALQIDFWTISGTAIEGQDFSALVGSTAIPAGETEWFLEVDVIGDAIAEPTEQFYLAARITGDGQGYAVGNSGFGAIIDDDSLASRVAIADAPTLIEGDQGLRDAVFPLTIDPRLTSTADLEFEIFPGSATYAADFLSQGGRVRVPAGTTRAEIRIPIVGDQITEAEEQFGILSDGLEGTPGSYLLTDELFLSGQIGMYVALDGERLLGGSYSVFGGVGQAVIYERDPGSRRWLSDALLVPSDGAIGANFGRRLVLDGDTAVIAAPTADSIGAESGAVYVFEKRGETWEETALLIPEDLLAGDRFGRAVCIDGDWMVATADQDDGQGDESGTAYIFHRVGGTWRLQQEISAGDGEGGDRFGQSAAISGDTIAIGAPYAGGSGAVYLFHRTGLVWSESARLVPADAADRDFFGWAVSVDGDWIAASARNDSNERGISAGAVYVLNQRSGSGGDPGFVTKLLKPAGAGGANLGYTIELDAGRLLAVPSQGPTSYVFTMHPDDPTEWQVTPIVSGNTDRWGSISDDTLALGSLRNGDAVVFQHVAAVATVQDDDRNELPVISIVDRSVAEPSGQPLDYSFDIEVIGNVLEPMSVDYRIVSGSALAGSDFESGSGTLEFPLVSSSESIPITVLPDSVPEPDETFYILFSNPRGGTLSAPWAEVTISEQRALEFVPSRSPLHVKVPTGAEGTAWRLPDFDLRGWAFGRSGIGYERSSGYESQIVLDVESMMYNRSEAILIRVPFEVEDPVLFESMKLGMKYDDGYAAFLNGVPVASRNAAAGLLRASDIHLDSEALVFEEVDLSDHLDDLVPGENVLAIHGLNSGATSSDFLIVPSLVAGQRLPERESFIAWQLRNGIAGGSAPGADTDGDRLADLVEYGLGSDPMVPELSPQFAVAISDPDEPLSMQFTLPSPAPPDVVYEIEVSGDLGNDDWAIVSSKVGNTPWQGVAEVTSVPGEGEEQVLIRVADIIPAGAGGRRFMRLRVHLVD